MSAFTEDELNYGRIDVQALLSNEGIATVDEARREKCLRWLESYGYKIDSIDFTHGLGSAVEALGLLLDWDGQFGYTLKPESRNLDALRDGFTFEISDDETGRMLELLRPDLAWKEDERWLLVLLEIIQEVSRYHLAIGERFFGLLVMPEDSPLLGKVFAKSRVPYPNWSQEDFAVLAPP